jgi:peptidoglycan/LPS O-acetylase OafA/YrhL
MKIKTMAAIYSILVGVSIIGIWTILYITSSIPEFDTEPMRIGMHLVAEIATGIILILGAYGLLRNKRWGYNIYLISMGMLIYTLLVSPGYYAEKGNYLFVGMFAIILFFTMMFMVFSFVKQKEFTSFGKIKN